MRKIKKGERIELRDCPTTEKEVAEHAEELKKVNENGGYYIICPKDKKDGKTMQGVCIVRELSKMQVFASVMTGLGMDNKDALLAFLLSTQDEEN